MRRLITPIAIVVIGFGALLGKGLYERDTRHHARLSPSLPLRESQYLAHSLRRYSLGFDNLAADLLWVELLQKASIEPLNQGHVSWEFAQLDAVTALDPKFERAYSFGAAFLSVFRQDRLGAKLILEKWVRRRPTYWRSEYTLGYHLFYEMNDYAAAAPHVLRAAALPGAPAWLTSLGIRLLSETGAMAQALKLAVELFPSLKEGIAKERLTLRIRSLRFHLERKAWEGALAAFRQTSGREPAGLEELAPLARNQVRDIAALVPTEDVPAEVATVLAERFHFRYDPVTRSIIARDPVSDRKLDKVGIYHSP